MFLLKLGLELQKLTLKIPIRSDDTNKIQTAFAQSGIFSPSGMQSFYMNYLKWPIKRQVWGKNTYKRPGPSKRTVKTGGQFEQTEKDTDFEED